MIQQIYLTERNLLTLLIKLNKKRKGNKTKCTIVKNDNKHPKYPQTMEHCYVTVVEDENYYIDRIAGKILEEDEKVVESLKQIINGGIKQNEDKKRVRK